MKSEPLSSLIVDVKPGERISFPEADRVSVELLHKSGKAARLRVIAPRDVRITRDDDFRCGDGKVISAVQE